MREPREWVGGRLQMLNYVLEPKPHRPHVVLWLELPDDLIVGVTLQNEHGAADQPSFAQLLVECMARPAAGRPRRPDRIRVASEELAQQVCAATPDIPVLVAPTPELDVIMDRMAREMPAADPDEAGYLKDRSISAATVARLFEVSAPLFDTAPWRHGELELLVDIPGLGINGAVAVLIGELGQSRGFLLFPDTAGYANFQQASRRKVRKGTVPNVGTSFLSLIFEPPSVLPRGMRREAMKHGWPIARSDAYPTFTFMDSDSVPRSVSESEAKVLAAAAVAIDLFVRQFEKELTLPEDALCGCYQAEGERVRLVWPWEDGAEFDAEGNRLQQPETTPQEELEIVRRFLAQYYRRWLDETIPALGGKTPREAIRTKPGRQQVALLLDEMEQLDQLRPEAERADFGTVRRELGLPQRP